jgi:protein phosphatase
MATTVAAVLLEKDKANIAHVGDSRVYLIRGGDIRLLTNDHSWVNEQVMSGLIDSEQARTHPLRNVVTRALGGKEGLEVDMQVLELQDGDLLLLCSDGLTSMVEDVAILEAVKAGGREADAVARRLVEAANSSGGEDNITAIALSFRNSSDEDKA